MRWIDESDLRTLRGMIIDRDEAWRADPEMAPVIEATIRKGLRNIDATTWTRIYRYLRYGPMGENGQRERLAGTYETYGFDAGQMAEAWRKYVRKHGYTKKRKAQPDVT
jgi:hypothetical protein